jgi:putative transposase
VSGQRIASPLPTRSDGRQCFAYGPDQPACGADLVEAALVREALANQTDSYRMICAFVRRRLGIALNRKRVRRVMRERKLIQRRRAGGAQEAARLLPSRAARQLWQLDLTAVWVAEHGWTYLMAIIDCCTREIVAWHVELRCRADEAIALIDRAAAAYGIEPGELTLGSDNGSAFTARRFRARLAELAIRHRRGGYRDPESHAFIESWFGKLKQREVWPNEYETLDDARPRDRRIRRLLPPPPPQRAQLPDAPGGAPDRRGSAGTTKKRPSLSTPVGSRSVPQEEVGLGTKNPGEESRYRGESSDSAESILVSPFEGNVKGSRGRGVHGARRLGSVAARRRESDGCCSGERRCRRVSREGPSRSGANTRRFG